MLIFPERKNFACIRDRRHYGWILYTEEDAVKNQEYIQMYREHGRKKGIVVELAVYQPVSRWDRQAAWRLREILSKEAPMFAINRTRDYQLAQQLEQWGIRVFNKSKIAELGNDKAKAYQYMEQHRIPILPTWQVTSENMGWQPKQYPVVAKSCRGHGGTEVFLLQNSQEWEKWRGSAAGDCVIQQMASEAGKDLRVYILDNQIVQAVLRTSQNDFRSNFSLGGRAVLYELSQAQRQLVERILSLVEIDMAAVDFLYDHGRLVFNELEDMAGARMLYSLSDYDIVKEYVEYIWRVVSHGNF